MKLTTDRHETSRGLFAIAELVIQNVLLTRLVTNGLKDEQTDGQTDDDEDWWREAQHT